MSRDRGCDGTVTGAEETNRGIPAPGAPVIRLSVIRRGGRKPLRPSHSQAGFVADAGAACLHSVVGSHARPLTHGRRLGRHLPSRTAAPLLRSRPFPCAEPAGTIRPRAPGLPPSMASLLSTVPGRASLPFFCCSPVISAGFPYLSGRPPAGRRRDGYGVGRRNRDAAAVRRPAAEQGTRPGHHLHGGTMASDPCHGISPGQPRKLKITTSPRSQRVDGSRRRPRTPQEEA